MTARKEITKVQPTSKCREYAKSSEIEGSSRVLNLQNLTTFSRITLVSCTTLLAAVLIVPWRLEGSIESLTTRCDLRSRNSVANTH